jgi:hypothetical protein
VLIRSGRQQRPNFARGRNRRQCLRDEPDSKIERWTDSRQSGLHPGHDELYQHRFCRILWMKVFNAGSLRRVARDAGRDVYHLMHVANPSTSPAFERIVSHLSGKLAHSPRFKHSALYLGRRILCAPYRPNNAIHGDDCTRCTRWTIDSL